MFTLLSPFLMAGGIWSLIYTDRQEYRQDMSKNIDRNILMDKKGSKQSLISFHQQYPKKKTQSVIRSQQFIYFAVPLCWALLVFHLIRVGTRTVAQLKQKSGVFVLKSGVTAVKQ